VRLFKSHRDGIGDGEQRRDFIYVDDAVAVMRWLLDTPPCRASSMSARARA
jgi:ADP-L-glycero-D-manno-heptose 6-epimerase